MPDLAFAKRSFPFTLTLLFAGFNLLLALGCAPEERVEDEAEARPNIIVVLTDDQAVGSMDQMFFLRKNFVGKGALFTDSFTSTPVCCPSRASILRGQYPHNHKVLTVLEPDGGYPRWKELGRNESNVATWLDNAGYTTAYMGKFMNEYHGESIPKGWDRWWGYIGGNYDLEEPGWQVNANGKIRTVPYHEYRVDADYLAEKATTFISQRPPHGRPFFLMVAPTVPHSPYEHASRHKDMFKKIRYPRLPSFNEADVSDKPQRIQEQPRLSPKAIAEIDETYRDRLRGLMAVDEMLAKIVRAVNETGHGQKTYFLYSSDNGFLQGEHRVFNTKGFPYEESIRIPLVVRGPDVPWGITRDQMVAEIDWAPTIADWAGITPPGYVDGRSLTPLLKRKPAVVSWRKRMLLEYFNNYTYSGVRTESDEVYVEWGGVDAPFKEYYDLKTDPYQLDNLYGQRPEEEVLLAEHLKALKTCAGADCRAAEN